MAQVSTPQLRSSGNAPVVVPFLGLLGPATAANMGAAAGIALNPSEGLVSDILVKMVLNGGETMAISAKDWGGATIAAANLLVVDAATGRQSTAAALATGTYYLPLNAGAGVIQSLIFTKSAAVNVGTAIVSCAYDKQANL